MKAGDQVLLYGAAGCIGTMAVQLAREMGAEATAVDNSTRKLDALRGIGAARVIVIDCTRDGFTRLGETWDAIIDMVGKSPWSASLACLREGGYYAHGNAPTSVIVRRLASAPFSKHRVRIALTGYNPKVLLHLSELAAQGRIRPVIDRTWSHDEIVEAHRYVDSGAKVGNVVLIPI